MSLTKDVLGVANSIIVVIGVVVVGIATVIGSAAGTVVDVATGAAIATNNNDAINVVVPPSFTKDEEACIGALVAFKGMCVGEFAQGAGKYAASEGGNGGSLAPWGTRTMAAPVNLIVTGNVIVVAIVSQDVAAKGGVDGAVPLLLLSSSTLLAAALYLIPPLNVRR